MEKCEVGFVAVHPTAGDPVRSPGFSRRGVRRTRRVGKLFYTPFLASAHRLKAGLQTGARSNRRRPRYRHLSRGKTDLGG